MAHQISLKQSKELKEDGVNALPFMTRASTLRIKCHGRARLLLRYPKPTWRKRILRARAKRPHDHSLWPALTRFHWCRLLMTQASNHLIQVGVVVLSVPSFQPGLTSSKWHLRIRLQLQDQAKLPPRFLTSLLLPLFMNDLAKLRDRHCSMLLRLLQLVCLALRRLPVLMR
jgi:hypothetical protein